MKATQGFVQWIHEALPSIIIAIGTLLAMISLRNSDIATRARNNVDEALYKEPSRGAAYFERRLAILRKQNRKLIRRYRLLSYSFILLMLSMVLFVASAATRGEELGVLLALNAGLFLFAGLVIATCEFIIGPSTLEMNNEILVSLDQAENDPNK